MSAWIRISLVVVFLTTFLSVPTAPAVARAETFDCGTVTDVPPAECQALVELFNSTNGTDWNTNINWLETTTVNNWYGIGVIEGHVGNIRLSNNNLIGTIPASMGNLINLRYLYLRNNQLSGSILPLLGSLNLLELFLNGNQFSGSIPTELGNLTSLHWLYLSDNQLNGTIPVILGNLTSLIWLNLSDNQLSGGIPAELGSLTSLTELFLDNNQLSGTIPPELVNLSSLQNLNLDNNQLSGSIPPELGSLTNLHTLNLSENNLSGAVPTSFTDLVNLCLPSEVWPCFDAYGLNLDYNRLTTPATPQALADFLAIKDPDWELTQWIPFTSCADVTQIPVTECNALVDFYNAVDGTSWVHDDFWLDSGRPIMWYGVTVSGGSVTALNLFNNGLAGELTISLSNLTNLQDLELYNNQLSGSIPPELGSLINLQDLKLYNNQLSGIIPPELGSLTNLQYLKLYNNHLTGSIPPVLGNLSYLQDINLSDNRLSGSIPAELGNLTRLHWLYLNGNQLSGSIPPELGSLTELRALRLQYNKLSGAVPATFTYLVNLLDHSSPDFWRYSFGLDLDYNRLTTWATPQELADFLALKDPDWIYTQGPSSIIFLPVIRR